MLGTALPGLAAAPMPAAAAAAAPAPGYLLFDASGRVHAFGSAAAAAGQSPAPSSTIAAATGTPVPTGGYLIASAAGHVASVAGARTYGSLAGIPLNRPIVGIAATPKGDGYWMVASDGGIFSFGAAPFYGSTGSLKLNKPIVGIAPTPQGDGYWLVASDGGIFAFGSAQFAGSTGSIKLNQPIVGMAAHPAGGYWLVASDGGIFSYGKARFFGSTGSIKLNQPIVGIAPTPNADGYWMVASDGGIFSFGNAPFLGSLGGANAPRVVAMAPVPVKAAGSTPAALPAPKPVPVKAPPAPRVDFGGASADSVLAVQGPTDPARAYVVVTWSRTDANAVGYDVLRDGQSVGSTTIEGDAWDDMSWRDTAVTPGQTYAYSVVPRYADGATGEAAGPSTLTVRGTAQVGSGKVFNVDDYAGTDLARASAAVTAARQAGGGVVQFGPRTYTFSGTLLVSSDAVVLRGAGRDQTFIVPSYDGDADACLQGTPLIRFGGTRTTLANTTLAEPVKVGDRTAKIANAATAAITAGQVLLLDQPVDSANPQTYRDAGVAEDPGTGTDARFNWDTNQVVSVDGDTVAFADAFSQPFNAGLPVVRLDRARGNGLELLTVQGRSAQESTYYKLVQLDHVVHFTMADVRGRWANRSYVDAMGYDIRVVGFDGPDGGPLSADAGTCKYKFNVHRASGFVFVDGTMGLPTTDANQSFITIQKAQRAVVRSSRFYGSKTYAINEHGSGGRHHLFENNYIAVGPNGRYAGILLGNDSFGFAGPTIIRNNTFEGNYRDLYMMENSYETRFVDNVSRGNGYRVVDAYGWAHPDTDPALWGSLRLTVANNSIADATGAGVVLGYAKSPWFPYAGVRDVVIAGNAFGTAGPSVVLGGDAATTDRFQVWDNTGNPAMTRPAFGVGDYWADNPDGAAFGLLNTPAWSAPSFG